jgi:hypothetical protein
MHGFVVRSEVLLAVTMPVLAFWVLKLFSVVGRYESLAELSSPLKPKGGDSVCISTCEFKRHHNPVKQHRHSFLGLSNDNFAAS